MKSLICIGLIASMVGPTSPAVLNTGVSNASKKVTTSISSVNTVSAVKVETKKIVSEDKFLTSELNIPVIKGLLDFQLQKEINSILEKDATNFKEQIVKIAEQYSNKDEELGLEMFPLEVSTNYKVCSNSNNFLSIYVDYYQYTGGAHGSTTKKCYNIDLKTGKILTLEDVFSKYPNYKDIINKIIKAEIQKHPENYFEECFKGISDDQCFILEGENLVVYFQQYDIAPYSSGMPEFKIPISIIKK